MLIPMLCKRTTIATSLFVFINAAFLLQGETSLENSELYLPENTGYTVGFCMFSDLDLSPENIHLKQSIPMLLKEDLESLEKHVVSVLQEKAYQKNILLDRIRTLNRQLIDLQKTKDAILFENVMESKKKAALEETEKKIGDIIKKIGEIKETDPAGITIPEELRIQIKSGEGAGLLLDPPSYSALQYTKTHGIDFLVYGHVEEIFGYLFISISAFDRLLEEKVFDYDITLSPEEVYPALDDIKRELSLLILGREWAGLVVIPDPPTGFVYVNDEFAGIGKTEVNYLKPGKAEVRVTHQDYFEEKKEVNLVAFEESECVVSLTRIASGNVFIDSIPEGANVYVNSVWRGITPLAVERSLHLLRIVIKKDDFDEISFHIGESGEASINVELTKSEISGERRQELKRDKFYTALGYFFVSIPFPVFFKGLADDYGDIRDYRASSGTDEYKRASIMQDAFLISHYGTLVVTGALFINLFVNLIDYIGAADRPIG
ncbi:MAG: PEGA domain-containing protein [Spirochaetales bacterium]|nr:PEGA domain-containing protein [Spirochaetales bacterium]